MSNLQIQVALPAEMEPFKDDLQFFFTTMVRKLHINRHKGFGEKDSLATMFSRMHGEMDELQKALYKESQFETALEAIDVANFGFLMATKLWGMTKDQYQNHDEASSFRADTVQKFGVPKS